MNKTSSPQAENGHIDIANEIAEALMKINLSAYQSRILWAIWRKTYGWHKKEDWIPNSQLVKMTGLRKGHVSRTLKELKIRNIVTNSGKKIAFNKNYRVWRELPKGERGDIVTNSGKKVTNSGGLKRNISKENNNNNTNVTNSGNIVVNDSDNLTSAEKHLQEKQNRTTVTPVYSPFSEEWHIANEILKTFTEATGKEVHCRKFIFDRLVEGYTRENFLHVIEVEKHNPHFKEEPAACTPRNFFGEYFDRHINMDKDYYLKQLTEPVEEEEMELL